MSEFKIIETQEQFDQAISDRLKRDREVQAKKYEGWISPDDLQSKVAELNEKIKTLEEAAAASETKLAEKDAEIAKSTKYKTDLEKTRIALSVGLPYQLAERLSGEDEESIRKDAEAMLALMGTKKPVAPLGSPEPVADEKSRKEAVWQNFAASFGNE